MALRGDDFLGVNEDDKERLLLLKGEAKSRRNLSSDVVRDARERLSADDGRPTPISLLFVADRMLEATDKEEQSLGRIVRDEVARKTVPARRITHGLFVLSGNAAKPVLEIDLENADSMHCHISIGFRVKDHRAFVVEMFEEASDLGND